MDRKSYLNIISQAEVSTSSRYFEPGVYVVQVDNCRFFLNRLHRPRVSIECTILETNNVNFARSNPVQSVIALDTDYGSKNVKQVIADILRSKSDELTPEVLDRIIIGEDSSEVSLLSGQHAIVTAYNIKTKAGGDFTKLEWQAYNPEKDIKPDFANMRPAGVSQEAEMASNTDSSWSNAGSEAVPF